MRAVSHILIRSPQAIGRLGRSEQVARRSAPIRRDRRSQYDLLCALCAPLCALCVENAVLQQRMALPVRRPTANAGAAATTAIQRRARRGRRGAIVATCGRGGFASAAPFLQAVGLSEIRFFKRRATPPCSANPDRRTIDTGMTPEIKITRVFNICRYSIIFNCSLYVLSSGSGTKP
jgi:hypothetical protein